MKNSFENELLSAGIQIIDENNGKYTFFIQVPPSSVGFDSTLLFDVNIPVGSVIIAKEHAADDIPDSKYRLAVFVCCNASVFMPKPIDATLVKNNRYWQEITNTGIAVVAV